MDKSGSIINRCHISVALKLYLGIIVPKMVRIVAVGISLAVVAIEAVHTMSRRCSLRTRISKPPFSVYSRNITCRLEHIKNGVGFSRERLLALTLHFTVSSDRRMS